MKMDLDFSKIKNELEGCVKLTVQLPPELEDKYSRTFTEIMVKQLTVEIERACSVKGLEKSNIELKLVFLPHTFMEHSSENVTYRRLLITDKGCSDKDLWIKWTRLNSAVAYSAFDTPSEDEILFELGEDVPVKVREREYRFLVKSDTDKYHSAMGRKNITEWRELIKRAVRRGDLEKVVNEVEIADHSDQVHDKLSSILSGLGIPVPKESPAPEPAPISNGFDAELEKARAAIFGESANVLTEEISVPDSVVFDFSSVAEIDSGVVASPEADGAFDPLSETDGITELAPDYEEPGEDSPVEEDSDEDSLAELCAIDGEGAVPETDTLTQLDGDGVNEILEAKLRLVDEAMARGKAEEEAERLRNDLDDLRRANDALTLENSKLRAECEYLRSQTERLTQEKERIESLRRAEADRLKDEIDARVRAENREKERLAEAARIAVENRKRIEEEQAAEAQRLLDEETKRRVQEEMKLYDPK